MKINKIIIWLGLAVLILIGISIYLLIAYPYRVEIVDVPAKIIELNK